MDFLLGGFADANLPHFSGVQAERYEALLELGDQELFHWLSGTAPVPEDYQSDVMDQLLAYARGRAMVKI